MKNTKRLIWFVFGVGVLAIASFLGIFYWRGSLMTASDYQPQTLLVFLSKPLNGSTAHVGEPIPVSAEANGSVSIESLELWIDGKLIDETKSTIPALKQLNGIWEWIPDKEGRATLMALGKDSQGQTVLSNPVVVNVIPANPLVMKIVPKAGDTINSLVKELNLGVNAAEGLNPGIGLDDPLEEKNPIELVIPAEKFTETRSNTVEIDDLEPVEPAPEPEPTQNPGGDTSKPPLIPGLDLEVDGCNINIKVTAKSDNAVSFHIYILRPDSDKSVMIAEQGPMVSGSSFSYTEKNAFGAYQIYADAQNKAGTSSTNPSNISVSNGACAQFSKKAVDVKVISRKLIDRLFCYVTIDEKTYIHVPNSSDSFMVPMASSDLQAWGKKVFPYAQLMARSGFDISAHLPSIYPKGGGTSHIKFDCWDWDANFDLGTIEKDMTDEEMRTYVMLSNENYDVIGIFGSYPYENANHIQISAPYNFKSTGNPDECGKHGPSSEYQNCVNMIKVGMAAYVWDYHKQSCFPGTEAFCQYVNIDGFRIYRHFKTGEPSQFAYGVAGKELVTAGFTQWPTDPPCNDSWIMCKIKNKLCYTVRAYKGSIESRDSNEVCLKDKETGTGTKTISLDPSLMGVGGEESSINKQHDSEYAYNTDDHIGISQDGNLEVGHDYTHYEEGWISTTTESDSKDYYGFIKFGELQPIMGKPIQSAVLKFRMVSTKHGLDGWWNYSDNCARRLYLSKEAPYFYLDDDPVKAVFLANLPDSITSDELQFDVTNLVKNWSKGLVNNGFLLSGVAAPLVMEEFDVCITNFNSFKLDVTYFPNP